MMKSIIRKDILTAILLVIALVLVGCSNSETNKTDEIKENIVLNATFEITVLNTGSSDCTIIQIEDKVLMIDTGLKSNGDYIIKTLKEKGITNIDYLILTHMDKDHIGGAPKILDNVTVNNVIAADYTKDSKQYESYISALNSHGITAQLPHENIYLDINNAKIEIFPAEKNSYEESNDYSIIVGITYGDYSYLFAGDAEEERLAEFINSNDRQYNFVKIPHHGRYNLLSETFIDDIDPNYAFITCSEEEPADSEELEMLKSKGINTYLSLNGDIIIKSDGKIISLEQKAK